MPTYNCEITDPKEWVSSAATCLTTGPLLAMCSNGLAIVVVSSDRGIWGATIAHNTDFPIFGVPIVILVTIQTHSFDYFETEGVENLYLSDAPGMTQYGNILAFGTITDPRQQRTTWTIDRSLEFVQQQEDAPFFLFASIKDPHPLVLVPPDLLEHYREEDMPATSLVARPARWEARISKARKIPHPFHGH